MRTVIQAVRRGGRLFVVLAFGAAVIAPSLVSTMTVDALLLSNRSITMVSTQEGDVSTDANGTALAAGTAGNGAQTRHTFTFTMATSGATIGSMAIQYCDTPLFGTTCNAPTNMDAATITSVQAETGSVGDFTVDTTTVANAGYFASQPCSGTGALRQNCILVSDATPTAETGTPTITISFGTSGTNWIKNPENPGVFYVRIATFSNATYGAANVVDDGAVAGSVNEDIEITAKVQEKLNFSVSGTTNAPSTTCAALPVGTGAITLGVGGVLDHTVPSTVNSYFRLSTNASAGSGTEVKYAGNLPRTVGNTFSIGTTGAVTDFTSTAGGEQFGLTIDSLDTQAGNGYSFTNLAPTANYDSTSLYSFDTNSMTTPVTIATTTAGETVTCDTGSVEYVANIGTTTEPGTYRTNIMYFATPRF